MTITYHNPNNSARFAMLSSLIAFWSSGSKEHEKHVLKKTKAYGQKYDRKLQTYQSV